MAALRDSNGRQVDYLRISVTDRCNLRCSYCLPEGAPDGPPYPLLSRKEILEVVKAVRAMGVTHVRLTGGEPLVRPDLLDIVQDIRDEGISDLSMTTNGTLLADSAKALKRAGLSRVNVSLDSLDPAVFRVISRNGDVAEVLKGIDAALAAGLSPVKVNVVVVAGVNDNEVEELARLSLGMPVSVRFIEVMPIGPDAGGNARSLVTADAVRAKLERIGPLTGEPSLAGAGPARTFRFAGAPGTVGFIAPLSSPFCAGCNRIRLTADGKLRPCLASDTEVDLLPALRTAEPQAPLQALVKQALLQKPKGHDLQSHRSHLRRMCQIGG